MRELAASRRQLPVQGVRLLMEASAKIPEAIHLEVGEPNINTPLAIRKAAEEAMAEGITHYTPNAGLLSLRETIVEDMKRKYNVNTSVDEIVVTTGAVTALMVAMLALVDQGEEVLIPDPAWPNYEIMALMQGAKPVPYPLKAEQGFIPDISQLETLVTEKTKAIMINTPGNPTGAVFTQKEIIDLLEFARKHDLFVISDEVYDGIIFDGEKHISPKTFDEDGRVISIYSFSKSYAMTGWRVGYAVAAKEIIATMTKLIEPVISCAPAFAQKAAETALNSPNDFLIEMANGYERRRDKAYELFVEANIKAYKPKGAFYMMVDISEAGFPSSEQFALTLLEEEKVAVGPGGTFGQTTKEMIRLSLATEERDLLEGVKRICRFIVKYKKKQAVENV